METDAKPAGSVPSAGVSPRNEPYFLTPSSYEIHHGETAISISESEKDVIKFVERKELLVSSFEYPRNGSNPGLVLVFNQESFEDKTYRFGSRRDVNEIITSMSRLGFNINKNHIFNDYTREDILQVTSKITKSDLTEYNCLIVFFLTHGEDINILHARDDWLQTHDLWKEFSSCKDLKDKPKMFIFQACKGNQHTAIATDFNKERKISLVPDNTFTSDYIGPDMLIVYSTTEGNVSFRDPRNGTWFIQELCKNFSAYGRRDDVVTLIIRATKCLCRNYFHHDDKGTIKKQMPIFVSTLRKKFYLNRNKDRNLLYKLIKDQENMRRNIKELEDKIEEMIQEKEKQHK